MPHAAWTAIHSSGLVHSVRLQHDSHVVLEMRSADSISSKTTDLVVNTLPAEKQSHNATPELHNLTFHEHDAVR